MKRMVFRRARIYTPLEVIENGYLVVEKGMVKNIGYEPYNSVSDEEEIYLDNMLIIPGFIDIHIHGLKGYDICTGDPEHIASLSRELVKYGITSFSPTTVSMEKEDLIKICKAVREVYNAWNPGLGARILGLHLEGPFISVEKRGVHRIDYIRNPSINELRDYLIVSNNLIRQITVAPEKPGALELIKYAVENGVIVSIGHTNASYEDTMKAILSGASKATHLFNAMKQIHHRDPGPIIALLETPSTYLEIIPDYIHLSKPVIKFIINYAGIDRVVLVSDLIPLAGLPDGRYRWIGIDIVVGEGVPKTLYDNKLVGGFTTLNKLINNIHDLGYSLSNAIRMATYNPACAIEAVWRERIGLLRPGFKADLVILDNGLRVRQTYVEGELVYST